MPELPDIELYLGALRSRIAGVRLERMRFASPFFLRTVDPSPEEFTAKPVRDLRRIGKRVVIGFEGDLFAVIHLMIAGRFRWIAKGGKVPGRVGLAALDFSSGTLVITEAGSKNRASLHLVRGEEALATFNPGGIEIFDSTLVEFAARLRAENHTVKRSLTDPHLFSGIGNAYSDEILHAARMSPLVLTSKLTDDDVARLFSATQSTLRYWMEKLRDETGDKFPEKVTAFREGMAVHGRFEQPCPECGSPVQRIVYADNETNYCARCQTGGRLLADRAMSRLLKSDWPRSLDEL